MQTLTQLGRFEKVVASKDAYILRKIKQFKEVSEKTIQERDRALDQRNVQKKNMESMKLELEAARASTKELERSNAALEWEKADLERENSSAALRLLKETTRLKESQSCEVTLERVRVQTAMIVK